MDDTDLPPKIDWYLEVKRLLELLQAQSRLLRDRPPPEPKAEERLLRLPEVLRRCAVSKKTLYRLEDAGKFPRRRRLAERAVGWAASEIRAWIANPAGWRSDNGP
ncbi:MAG: AlpA family phage regulatory protein [Candidatus Binataceae bacterium]